MVTKYLIYLMSIHAKLGFQIDFHGSNLKILIPESLPGILLIKSYPEILILKSVSSLQIRLSLEIRTARVSTYLKTNKRRKKDRPMSRSTKILNWLCLSINLDGVLRRCVFKSAWNFCVLWLIFCETYCNTPLWNTLKNQIPAFAKLENCSDDVSKGSKCSYTCGTGYENTCGNKKRRTDFDYRSLSKSIIPRRFVTQRDMLKSFAKNSLEFRKNNRKIRDRRGLCSHFWSNEA